MAKDNKNGTVPTPDRWERETDEHYRWRLREIVMENTSRLKQLNDDIEHRRGTHQKREG